MESRNAGPSRADVLMRRQHAKQRPLVIAHRGGAGLLPENTMPAFRNAVALGCDALELDVHGTRDGHIVVSHDPSVDRTTEGTGSIRELSLAEVQRLRVTPSLESDCRIPRLAELFDAFPQIPMIIDIKQRDPDIVEPFCDLLRAYERERVTVVGSFHASVLRRVRRRCPETPTSFLPGEVKRYYARSFLSGMPGRLGQLLHALWPVSGPTELLIPERQGAVYLLSPRLLRSIRRDGLFLGVWTVNEREAMQRMTEKGVHGIITDYPDVALEVTGQ